jgi:hypothetical protein
MGKNLSKSQIGRGVAKEDWKGLKFEVNKMKPATMSRKS